VTDKQPIYPRLLGLKNISPNAWQRAVLGEGMVVVGLLALAADLTTAWTPLILPVAVGAVVKMHDVVAGWLPARAEVPVQRPGSDELWTLVQDAQRRAVGGAVTPFALVETEHGPLEVGAPATAVELLTPEEQAGALRAGLTAAAPRRAVLVDKEGAQLVAYERGLPGAVVVEAEGLTVVESELGNVLVNPGSSQLWALLEQARGAEGPLPFVLVETGDGVQHVLPPSAAVDVLTPEELIGAMRAGLLAAPPARAVVAFDDGYVGYEAGLGLLLDRELVLTRSDLPPLDSEKAPAP
jgi:hypothetical protein